MLRRVGTAFASILALMGAQWRQTSDFRPWTWNVFGNSVAGEGLFGHVLLQPEIRLLFDDRGLFSTHASGQNGSEILVLVVAASAGDGGPEVGQIRILANAASAPIEKA